MRDQGRPSLKFKDVAIEEKHEFKWRDINLNRWQESANNIPIWRTYQTLLKPRTVLVEPTDCHDDDILGRSNHL